MLFLDDCYLRKCDATIEAVEGDCVGLDRTVFYPTGGGVPCDTGVIRKDSREFRVTEVSKKDGKVLHKIEGECTLSVGDKVECEIDWERRYKHMRMHTSAHLLGNMMFKRGTLVTGNQIGFEQTRFDFNCPTGLQREMFDEAIAELNGILKESGEVKTYTLPREEALKIEGMIKLANKLPPSVEFLRIVDIAGIDVQADGGPHVKDISEIGSVKIEKVENKGTANKRLYYSLVAPQA